MLEDLLAGVKPPGPRIAPIRPALVADECEWFLAAVDAGLVEFHACQAGCPRLRRWGVAGGDEFVTPAGQLRHLYSAPGSPGLRLNREYVPHIAAYGYAILHAGYRRERSAFSQYRSFSRDLISKRAGQRYETDAEFCDVDGGLYLHVEVKTWSEQVEHIVAQLDTAAELRALPRSTVKELEYVLDLAPSYLWIVGPGAVDPPAHVFRMTVAGMNASFERREGLPPAP